MKTIKSDAVAEHQGSNSNSTYPKYDPNTKMMNFMVVMLVARDNNPQVISLEMDF